MPHQIFFYNQAFEVTECSLPCRSTQRLSERAVHAALRLLQRPECDGAARDGRQRNPTQSRRPHPRQSAQLRQQAVFRSQNRCVFGHRISTSFAAFPTVFPAVFGSVLSVIFLAVSLFLPHVAVLPATAAVIPRRKSARLNLEKVFQNRLRYQKEYK